MNVWLSSSEEHPWNPNQKTPATPWEGEIDRLIRLQAASMYDKIRKRYLDQVQEIVADQVPFIYLINKDAMVGISPLRQGVSPVAVRAQTYWNIERIQLAPPRARNGN